MSREPGSETPKTGGEGEREREARAPAKGVSAPEEVSPGSLDDCEGRSAPLPGAEPPPPGGSSVFDPVFEDPSLWPLLIVAVLSTSSFGAALVALTFQDRNLLAMGGLAVLATVSFHLGESEWRRTHRLRTPLVVVAIWLSSFALGFTYLAAFPRP